ncbi:hypothetical protein [Kitasatospora sp. NPDC001683]
MLPDAVLEALLTARDDEGGQVLTAAEIRQELEFSRQIPQSIPPGEMVHHPNPELRAQATGL